MLISKTWMTAFAVVLAFVISACGTEVIVETFWPQFGNVIWIRAAGGILALVVLVSIFNRPNKAAAQGASASGEGGMRWFARRKRPVPTIKSPLGVFSFDGTSWLTEPAEGELYFLSTKSELDPAAFERAQALVQDLEAHRQSALAYAQTHGANVWLPADGDLQLEAVDITDILQNEWGLTFGVAGQPDFTVTVEFRDGKPVDIWGAD